MVDTPKKHAPWHLWLVGILSLVWHAGGTMDYYMSKTRNPEYLAQMTEGQLAFLDSFPTWATATWAIAVFGALLASVLLLLRMRLALPVAAIGFVAMLATTFHNLVLSEHNALAMMTPFQMVFTAVIFIATLLFLLYLYIQTHNGVLR